MAKKKKFKGGYKPKFERSDIPYADRLLMDKLNGTAAHRNDAASIAMKVACVALNDTEGLGYQRLSRFAKRLAVLLKEYYAQPDVEDQHLNERLTELGFLVRDGHMFCVENSETGEIVPVKMLDVQHEAKKEA